MSRFFAMLLLSLAACTTNTKKQEELNDHEVLDNSKEIVCFLYHRFGDSRYPSTNISLLDFEAHLNYLKTHDFKVFSFDDAIDYLKSDSPHQKVAVITIDDGYASFYKNAMPLLKKYDFPATLFINTKTVGGGDYMDWNEINEVKKRNIEIGNHTHSHSYFLNRPEAERYTVFEEELKLTQQLIHENTGELPTTFAYPYGELDTQMKDIVEKLGFKAGVAQNSGVIYNGTDLMACPRFPMSESYAALSQFRTKAEMKALRVSSQTPNSFVLPKGETRPVLELTFERKNLQPKQLQCFIQGGECKVQQTNEDGNITLTIAPTAALSNRRTLYTITIPDEEGNWHWFSHLWINLEKKR